MKGLILAAALVVGCQPSEPPPPETQEYVVDFGGLSAPLVITADCTERPSSHETARYYCNLEDLHARVVTPEQWAAYSAGDPYPSINP